MMKIWKHWNIIEILIMNIRAIDRQNVLNFNIVDSVHLLDLYYPM